MPSLRTLPDSSSDHLSSEGRDADSLADLLTVPPPAPATSLGSDESVAVDDLLATPAAEAHVPLGTSADPASKPLSPSSPVRGAAFTRAELGLAGLIVMLAAGLAFTGLAEWRDRRRADRCAAHLRTLAAVFEGHRRNAGAWPAAALEQGAFPPGMEAVLPRDPWSQPTPFGGHYSWVNQGAPALAITAFVPDAPLACSRRDLQRIDRLLDDGNLATGRFRTGYNGWPVYLLAPEN